MLILRANVKNPQKSLRRDPRFARIDRKQGNTGSGRDGRNPPQGFAKKRQMKAGWDPCCCLPSSHDFLPTTRNLAVA